MHYTQQWKNPDISRYSKGFRKILHFMTDVCKTQKIFQQGRDLINSLIQKYIYMYKHLREICNDKIHRIFA